MTDLRTLPGVGAGLAAELRAAGLRDVEALRAAGVDEAATRLAEFGLRDPAQVRQTLVAALGQEPPAAAPAPAPVLGVHTVVFTVGHLDSAVAHYAAAGVPVSARSTDPPTVLLHTGPGAPGLLLREDPSVPDTTATHRSPRVWLAVPDVAAVAAGLRASGIDLLSEPFAIGTGHVVEIADRWGNVVGFATARP